MSGIDEAVARLVERIRADRRAAGLPENITSERVQRLFGAVLASAARRAREAKPTDK